MALHYALIYNFKSLIHLSVVHIMPEGVDV